MILHTTVIHYTSIPADAEPITGRPFLHGRPARLCLCVQNKCTPVHTPLRGWSDSEIMAGGEEMEGKIERREWKEK